MLDVEVGDEIEFVFGLVKYIIYFWACVGIIQWYYNRQLQSDICIRFLFFLSN